MILVKTLIFLLLILIICHVYNKLSDRNEKREGYTEKIEGNTKIPTKSETDKVTHKTQQALNSLQLPKQHQELIINKIKEFKLNETDMSHLQDKLQELLTLSESSKNINERLTQNK